MAAIRFPTTAVPLLSLCKGHGTEYIFKTYADLLSFVAAFGFHLVSGNRRSLPSKLTFADTPNAIGLEVFENRGLYSNFLMIALAHTGTRDLAEDEDLLVKEIERFAATGADELAAKLHGFGPQKAAEAIHQLFCFNEDDNKI